MTLDALILAGGRATRLGGVVKPEIVIGDRTLISRALAAADAAGASRIAVVGPPGLAAPPVLTVRETPTFGGPVAGIAAGLAVLSAEWVLLLASDLPRAREAAALLVAAGREAPPEVDGVCLVDADGREQWLAGLYRRQALQGALDAIAAPGESGVHGASVGRLLATLRIEAVPDPDGAATDVDTWQDVERARRAEERDTVNEKKPHLPPEALDDWLAALAAALDLDPAEVPTAVLLDVAAQVAHGVARPAAPLSTYLVGLAAARAGGDDAAVRRAAGVATELAARWGAQDGTA